MNPILLQSWLDFQQKGPLQISHGHEEKTNGAYRNRSPSRNRFDRLDMIRDGRMLETPNKRSDRYMYYYSSCYDNNHDHHRYHPYRRSDRGYISDDFRK